MSFVIQASKLTKIFCIRDWMQKCLADPSLIHSDEPFSITIPRSAGAVKLAHLRPVHAASLLPRMTTIHNKKGEVTDRVLARVPGDDEVRNLIPWITGGPDGAQYVETDRWGVVELPDMSNYMALQADFWNQEALIALHPEQASQIEADRQKLMIRMRAEMRSAVENAVARADERVMRAIKSCYRNFYTQNRTNLESGAGKVSPTDCEKLVVYFLHDRIKERSEKEKDVNDKIKAVMQQHVVGGN